VSERDGIPVGAFGAVQSAAHAFGFERLLQTTLSFSAVDRFRG
jgi:hypothetical protein